MESLSQINTSPDYNLFLYKFIKILKQLGITEKNMEAVYYLLEENLGFGLDPKTKNNLFNSMKEISEITKVEKDYSECCCFLGRWSGSYNCFIGFLYQENINKENFTKKAFEKKLMCVKLIDLNNQNFSDQGHPFKSLSSQPGVNQSAQKQYNNNVLSSVENIAFEGLSLNEFHDLKDVCHNLNNLLESNNLQGQSVLNQNENQERKNSSINKKTHSIEQNDYDVKQKYADFQKVLDELQDFHLSTEALVRDYGKIKFSEFFRQLVFNFEDEKNKRWVRMFLQKISDRWTSRQLTAIREYIRKYYPCK